ncbi:MAG: hypothetical protein QM488_03350 [Rhizobiaceae bacterium]
MCVGNVDPRVLHHSAVSVVARIWIVALGEVPQMPTFKAAKSRPALAPLVMSKTCFQHGAGPSEAWIRREPRIV